MRYSDFLCECVSACTAPGYYIKWACIDKQLIFWMFVSRTLLTFYYDALFLFSLACLGFLLFSHFFFRNPVSGIRCWMIELTKCDACDKVALTMWACNWTWATAHDSIGMKSWFYGFIDIQCDVASQSLKDNYTHSSVWVLRLVPSNRN